MTCSPGSTPRRGVPPPRWATPSPPTEAPWLPKRSGCVTRLLCDGRGTASKSPPCRQPTPSQKLSTKLARTCNPPLTYQTALRLNLLARRWNCDSPRPGCPTARRTLDRRCASVHPICPRPSARLSLLRSSTDVPIIPPSCHYRHQMSRCRCADSCRRDHTPNSRARSRSSTTCHVRPKSCSPRR